MRARTLLTLTALASMLIGALVVYLVLTVPNDLQAAELMKRARADMSAGRNDQARDSLSKIVQQYPRTDAAAAATVALVKMAESERETMQQELTLVRRENQRQSALLAQLQQSVDQIRTAPAKVAAAEPPAPKPAAVAKTAPPKKKTPPKKTSKRRRR
ncbi:MAG TPA: hypothetical protein VF698_08765 [Thermoanaerobaculia bacterium]|jgi:hypothetical protein